MLFFTYLLLFGPFGLSNKVPQRKLFVSLFFILQYPKISIQKGDKRATQFFSVGLETPTKNGEE